jgi:hypothetical protein
MTPTKSTKTSVVEANSDLQIVLAEYGHQHDKLKSSKDTVNQSLTLYLSLMAFLVPVAGSALAVGLFNSQDVASILSAICLLAASASVFTLMRTYQARIEQTDAEKALSRLRNFILTTHPNLKKYYSGPSNDDWPTPYTNRWASSSFWGWLALAFMSGVFTALSTLAFMVLAFPLAAVIFRWAIPLIAGMCVFLFCYWWLDRKLKYRAILDVPNFPAEIRKNKPAS